MILSFHLSQVLCIVFSNISEEESFVEIQVEIRNMCVIVDGCSHFHEPSEKKIIMHSKFAQ